MIRDKYRSARYVLQDYSSHAHITKCNKILIDYQEQFVEEVHGSGVLVYLSATWLSELYQQVLACNLMEKCGYSPNTKENNALVNVLTGKSR